MKHSLTQLSLLMALSISTPRLFSQKVQWEKSYGGKHSDYLMDAKPTPDYGFILAGSSLSKKTGNKTEGNNGDLDYWIWKMKENGDLDWQKNFGGSGSDFLQSIALTKDAGYILAGTSSSNKGFNKEADSNGGEDFWIIKLTATGSQEWQKTIGGSGQDKLQSILQTTDGGYLLAGSSSSEPVEKKTTTTDEKTAKSYGNLDYWVVKIDSKGKIEWQETYGGLYSDELRSVAQTKDGGYILGGYSNSPESGTKTENNKGIGDYWVVKIDKKGIVEWQKTIGGDQDDQLYVVYQTYDKGYVLGGNSNSQTSNEKSKSNENGTDFWVVKLDENGKMLWQQTYNFGKVDVLTSLVENEDHTLLLGGFAQGEMSAKVKGKSSKVAPKMKKGTDDFIALKVSETGEELWSTIVGSDGTDILKKVIETRDGGYLMTGTSNSRASRDKNSAIGQNDFWVVKLKDEQKPEKVKLNLEASPNPTQGYTNIVIGYEFDNGTATLVDLAGRVLQTFEITSKTVPVDLSTVPEGIYIVNLKTNYQGKETSEGVKIIKGITKN